MDTGIVEGSAISMYYDPMISKVLVETIKNKRQTYIYNTVSFLSHSHLQCSYLERAWYLSHTSDIIELERW